MLLSLLPPPLLPLSTGQHRRYLPATQPWPSLPLCRRLQGMNMNAGTDSNADPASSLSGAPSSGTSAPLLPELAQLQHLESLFFLRYAAPPWPAIPPQWLTPAKAFPRLKW